MRLDHINLSVPEGGVDAEARWLVDLLGYKSAQPGPDSARLGPLHWFEADDGTQVHLTVDPEHHPSKRAHTAIYLGERLDPVIAQVEASGQEVFEITNDGRRQVFAHDPAGNLWELIGPSAS